MVFYWCFLSHKAKGTPNHPSHGYGDLGYPHDLYISVVASAPGSDPCHVPQPSLRPSGSFRTGVTPVTPIRQWNSLMQKRTYF